MRVVIIAAQSLDGYIARHDTPGTDFTSAADRAWFPACLRSFDACVMGSETWRAARADILAAPYPNRRRIVMTRNPAAYAEDAKPELIEFTSEPAPELAARLRMDGIEHLAVLGGSVINGLFLDAGLVDEFWITLEPLVFGKGRPLAEGKFDVAMSLTEVTRLGPDTMLLKYTVKR